MTPGDPDGGSSDPAGEDGDDAATDGDGVVEASESPADVPEDAFVEMDVGDVAARPSDDDEPDRAGAVVPKRSYCERCEYFADPPAVACTHEGTEIVELVDSDHFRVVSCPVVAQRRRIGDVTSSAAEDG